MERLRGALTAGVLAGFLVSCGSVDAPETLERDALTNYPNIVAEGGIEEGVRYVDDHVEAPDRDTPMRVAVTVRSVADHHMHIQYQFEFLDRAGRPLRAQSGWRFKTFDPRIQYTLTGNALEPEGVEWRLRIRPAR